MICFSKFFDNNLSNSVGNETGKKKPKNHTRNDIPVFIKYDSIKGTHFPTRKVTAGMPFYSILRQGCTYILRECRGM